MTPKHCARFVSGSLNCRGAVRWLKRQLMLLGLLASVITASGPVASASETVVIAGEDDWAPYSSEKGGQHELEGTAVDIVREAFATQSIEVKFVAVPFSRCMFLAETGGVSGCFNATIVDGNREKFNWHPTPMFNEELAIFGRTGGPKSLKVGDLAGKSVGYTLGYTYPTSFMLDSRIKKVSAKSDRFLLDMLNASRVDYILINTGPAYLRVNNTPALKGRVEKVGVVSSDGFWVAFTRANPDGKRFAEIFEKGLLDLKSSGRYQELELAHRRRIGL